MALLDEVSEQIKDAMRAKDKDRLTALRGIRAAFIEALKADGADQLPDEKALSILRKLAKQRKESIELYHKGGRADLEAQERAELDVIERFLPQLADEETTRKWVEEAIAASGASSPRDMGRVMGHIMKHHKAEVDGKVAKTVAMKLLAG